MSWASIFSMVVGGAGWLAFGLIALRMSGVKKDRDDADRARKDQAKELENATAEFIAYRTRMDARLEDLENELEHLEDELDACSGPGDRRRTLNRLLQKARDARGDAADGMP